MLCVNACRKRFYSSFSFKCRPVIFQKRVIVVWLQYAHCVHIIQARISLWSNKMGMHGGAWDLCSSEIGLDRYMYVVVSAPHKFLKVCSSCSWNFWYYKCCIGFFSDSKILCFTINICCIIPNIWLYYSIFIFWTHCWNIYNYWICS